MVVTNDLIGALDKNNCVLPYLWILQRRLIHWIINYLDKLRNSDFGSRALKWFKNYLRSRTQGVQTEGYKSDFHEITKGVSQGSILAPISYYLK